MKSGMSMADKYPVTVDVVIFTVEEGRLKVLLIKRALPPFLGRWALPGGFLRAKEATKAAAKRILRDKAGLAEVYLEQLYTFDEIGRDPRAQVISVVYFALVDRNKMKIRETAETQTPSFFDAKLLPKLAFDHKRITSYAHERLQYKLEYTNAAYSLLPKKFTLTQLQGVYEAIRGQHLDKRNFRKKFLSLGLIKPTNERASGGRARPARLYSFKEQKSVILKRFF